MMSDCITVTEQDRDNLRSMRQMRDRSPIENAAYAMAALSHEDRIAASVLFNNIFSPPGSRVVVGRPVLTVTRVSDPKKEVA
jgi:hypothetical protein